MAFNEEASFTLGWISIACWVIVYSPQIIENYRLKSGEGLSIHFLVIWTLADLFNLIGAVMAVLMPTVIILPIYYLICDAVLFYQVYYYRWKEARARERVSYDGTNTPSSTVEDETAPLLAKKDAHLVAVQWKYTTSLAYLATVLFVLSVGALAWIVSGNHHDSTPKENQDVIEWKGQAFGWLSAVLYIASRIPQIAKNRKTHCAGLSVALFIYAILGNLTYIASILMKSLERKHLLANISWLVGSGGTVALDFVVAWQFIYYRKARGKDTLSEASQHSNEIHNT